MSKDWTQQENPDRLGLSLGWRILAVIAVIAVIGLGVWGFRVVTSPVKGEGDATIQKNSAANRIAARQEYQNIYEDVQGADQRIDVFADAYAANKSTVNQTNLTGAKTYCIARVREYNALAKKYLSADFRPETLPAEIDQNDPAFDCKETVK
jgi:hypothetical protein